MRSFWFHISMVSFPFNELLDCSEQLLPADSTSPNPTTPPSSKSKVTFKSTIDAVCPGILDTKLNSSIWIWVLNQTKNKRCEGFKFRLRLKININLKLSWKYCLVLQRGSYCLHGLGLTKLPDYHILFYFCLSFNKLGLEFVSLTEDWNCCW